MHALATAALLLSFALLLQRRPRTAIATYALQSALLAAAAAWQAWAQSAPPLWATAALILAANATLLPILNRLAPDAVAPTTLPMLLLALALTALALRPIPGGDALAYPLAILLLGLLMLCRRHPFRQAIGLLSVGNGLLLVAIGAGLPLLPELAAALLALLTLSAAALVRTP